MAVPSVTTSLKKYKGKWGQPEVKHLLKRTLFGAKKEDIDYFTSRSLRHTIQELLNTAEPIPGPPVNNYNDDKYSDEEIQPGVTWITAVKYSGMNGGRRRNSFKAWWMGCMLDQQRTLREKMVLFWHNHFATETTSVDNPTMIYKHNVLLRQYALGNFKAMVRAVTIDAAMLKYLNGNANTKKAPDENYGRELQELFTVGKGPGSHYTEADVKAAARILTGFRIDNKSLPDVHGTFDAGRHDESDKQFSPFYNNQLIKGRKGKEGEMELDELLDLIFQQPEVARFICRKLYRFFVYHQIDEATEKTIIEPLAHVFRQNNYEVKPVLEKLFTSRHFFDMGNRGGIIKSPVDFAVGLCREYSIPFPGENSFVEQYGLWANIQQTASQMQQNIGDPPNVAGWPAYYQEPMFDKSWISSDTLPKRTAFTDRMVTTGFNRNGMKIAIDPVQYAKQLSAPGDPNKLIDELTALLYAVDLPAEEKQYMKTGILLQGLQGMASDHYWTDAWQKLQDKPDDAANTKNVTNKLKNLLRYMMSLPQYQLM
ncbi:MULTISPECIES: DUF1800 domain-containing protein [Niastella]|uniref:DUF1800 domain-containing protein n=1 Tax=Niastella soli TaxID=2821487 RepID=A0ABS3YWK7_9BACT|nr:DUF1800 domain-containing protein [Niastella soli]MBO9201790.1 DUF1800 domain-containing protein [Niastella soli]